MHFSFKSLLSFSLLGYFLSFSCILPFISSCKSTANAEKKKKKRKKVPLNIYVFPKKDIAVYSYQLNEGEITHRDKPGVVEGSKDTVIVTPLFLSGRKRGSTEFLWLAENSKLLNQEKVLLRRISRMNFEKSWELEKTAIMAKKDLENEETLIFTTAWCGACSDAKEFLDTAKIPYQEIDIEKNPNGKTRLGALLSLNKQEFQGVPVVSIKGKTMTGFDPDWVKRQLKTE